MQVRKPSVRSSLRSPTAYGVIIYYFCSKLHGLEWKIQHKSIWFFKDISTEKENKNHFYILSEPQMLKNNYFHGVFLYDHNLPFSQIGPWGFIHSFPKFIFCLLNWNFNPWSIDMMNYLLLVWSWGFLFLWWRVLMFLWCTVSK